MRYTVHVARDDALDAFVKCPAEALVEESW